MEKLKESCFIYVNPKYVLWESDVFPTYITLVAKYLSHLDKSEFSKSYCTVLNSFILRSKKYRNTPTSTNPLTPDEMKRKTVP